MGNQCSGRREKLQKAGRVSRHLIHQYKEDLKSRYEGWRDEAREKYEDARFRYRLKKAKAGDSLVRFVQTMEGSTKFQEVLVQFEK